MYPSKRISKDQEGKDIGVTGKVTNVQNAVLAEQPIGSFDWSSDKLGLCVFASYDQQVRVGMVTRLAGL